MYLEEYAVYPKGAGGSGESRNVFSFSSACGSLCARQLYAVCGIEYDRHSFASDVYNPLEIIYQIIVSEEGAAFSDDRA